MIKILILLVCFCLTIPQLPQVSAQSLNFSINQPLLNWIKFNVSPVTQLPYSFYVPEKEKVNVYQRMESSGAIQGSIERMITREGLDIYDGAVYQIVLSLAAGEENLKRASLVNRHYWEGSVGDTWNIRAGYPINTFIYDPQDPEGVTSDLSQKGKRGFIFRIISADGNYLVTDPLDGKKHLAGFPNDDRLHWVDWKPVAGENAWVVMAAMQIHAKRPGGIELELSTELARAAMILQSDIGGIRMAPLGTHRTLGDEERKYFTEENWWYNHISTENNLSWYAAFRMLYQVTQDIQYKEAMEGIERFLHLVWDKEQGIFHQGAYFINGQWVVSKEHFALDVQTWGIACLGAAKVDAWFGPGAAWRLWQEARARSGVVDKNGLLLGVGYTDEHDRISVEWSAGAMIALDGLANYYKSSNPSWSIQAINDRMSMRLSMENLRYNISQTLDAYSYSSRRGEIPFGWNSHDPQVLSLASTGWMIFVDAGFNPFWLL